MRKTMYQVEINNQVFLVEGYSLTLALESNWQIQEMLKSGFLIDKIERLKANQTSK